MCGIIGYASFGPKPDAKVHEAFQKMFMAVEERGRDASGFAYIEGGELKFHKNNVSSSKLVLTEEFQSLKDRMPRVMIAHCRLKTQGCEKKNVNNHPVVDEKFGWALVHNGVVWNDAEVFSKFNLKRSGQVDTEAILRLFQMYMVQNIKTDPTRALKRTVAKLRGQATFAMLGEEHPERLYLYKGNNPLALVYVEAWKTVFFASRAEYVRGVLTETEQSFGKFRRRIDKYGLYLHEEIKDDTIILIDVADGSLKVTQVKAKLGADHDTPKGRLTYYSTGHRGDDGPWDTGGGRDYSQRMRVGAGYYQNPDGTIQPTNPRRRGAHEYRVEDMFENPEVAS